MVNETDDEILVFVCGAPPEQKGAEMFDKRRLRTVRLARARMPLKQAGNLRLAYVVCRHPRQRQLRHEFE
jgi:hypothetical protein